MQLFLRRSVCRRITSTTATATRPRFPILNTLCSYARELFGRIEHALLNNNNNAYLPGRVRTAVERNAARALFRIDSAL